MDLHVRRWGDGPEIAVLVHGYTDDSSTWWRVGPVLAEQGYTVLAPDLRGHGLSPRGTYSLDDFAADLVQSVPHAPALAVGHSLGAAVLQRALPVLRPAQAVLVDPPWEPNLGDVGRHLESETLESVAATSPLWSPEDVLVDVDSGLRLDPAVTAWIETAALRELGEVTAPVVPTRIIHPATGGVMGLSPARARALGYELSAVPGVGHVIHRDDFDAFLSALCGEVHVVATQSG